MISSVQVLRLEFFTQISSAPWDDDTDNVRHTVQVTDTPRFRWIPHWLPLLDNVNVMKIFSYKLKEGISDDFRASNGYRHKRRVQCQIGSQWNSVTDFGVHPSKSHQE